MKSYTDHILHKFFYPESVAVIGASSSPTKISHHLAANLVKLGYSGRLYAVHPTEKEFMGLKVMSHVNDIPEIVDLAVIGVSHTQTLSVLQACIEKGIKRLVIVAGGFSEIGEEGKKVQKALLDLVKTNGVRAIGPNALSPITPGINFAISFQPLEKLQTGGLSLIFQSGLYEPRLPWFFSAFNLHLNKLIDLGNKMDLNEVDALSYLVFDPETRVIGIHMESIAGDGRKFLELLRQASALGKPVVVLKSGRTEAGAKAASSHTGALVQGNDMVFDHILRQCGAIRAYTIDEFFNTVRALERFGALSLPGNRLAIATLSGGEAVIMTDLVQQAGLKMATVSGKTLERLQAVAPPFWSIPANPFDLGITMQFHGPAKAYAALIPALADDENVDAIHVQIAARAMHLDDDVYGVFHKARALGKPIVLWAVGLEPGTNPRLTWLEEHGVPVFPSAEKALHALAALHHSSRNRMGIGTNAD